MTGTKRPSGGDGTFVVPGSRWPRHLLVALEAYFGDTTAVTVSLDDFAAAVLDRLDGPDTPSPNRVRLRLHHVDLPRLAQTAVVDYDARTHTVRYLGGTTTAKDGELSRVLAALDERP